ncbi:hypothetical protein HDU86_005476 [Geranomyces michiganensis]|nr:hypothetical protein HDU86_005476 [Geranomyces michiganensis]
MELVVDMAAQGHPVDRKTSKLLLLSLQPKEQPLDLCAYLDRIADLRFEAMDFKPALHLCYENADMDAFSAIVAILRRRKLLKAMPTWLLELELKIRAKHRDFEGPLGRPQKTTADGELDMPRHSIIGHALFGDIEEAERIYQQLDHTTIALSVHEAMINAYLKVGRLADARKLYRACRDRGLRFSVHLYSALLHAFVMAGDVRSFQELVGDVRAQGVELDTKGYSSIVEGTIKFGDMNAAVNSYRSAIRDLKSRYRGSDVQLALINGLIEKGRLDEASQHIEDILSMDKGGSAQRILDPVFIVTLARNLAKGQDFVTAKWVLEWFVKIRGKDLSDGMVLAELVEIYIRLGDIGGAFKLIKAMKGLSASRARSTDLKVTGGTVENADKSRFGSTIRQPPLFTAYATVISEFARLGLRDEALMLVDEVIEEGFQLTYKLMQPLIGLYASEGDRPACLALFKLMLDEHGAIPTANALETVYASYLKLYTLMRSNLSARMGRKKRWSALRPLKSNTPEHNFVAAHNDAEETTRPLHNLVQDLKPMIESAPAIKSMAYEAAINIHLEMGEEVCAELLFMDAHAAQVQPTEQTFQRLVFMYEQGGDHSKAAAVRFEMESTGVSPRTEDSLVPDVMAEPYFSPMDWPGDLELKLPPENLEKVDVEVETDQVTAYRAARRFANFAAP